MTMCFCGFDHSKKMKNELRLLAEAYHDAIQHAFPSKDWRNSVAKLQTSTPPNPAFSGRAQGANNSGKSSKAKAHKSRARR